MKIKNKAFTLVELLVVITILAIISIVAYQNFGWVVGKALTSRKIADIASIENWLQQYRVEKNYYPKTWEYSSSNLWWYTGSTAYASNKIVVTKDWEEISILNLTSTWWWKVYWSWTIWQIWAKWTISQKQLWKKYLSKDLYDPELWDIRVWSNKKMIDYWIWRYVYAVYRNKSWTNNQKWTAYNIAYTIKDEIKDSYITKISWDYGKQSCYGNSSNCPDTLIWTLSGNTDSWVLLDWSEINDNNSNNYNYWIPYAITDFAE